VTGAVSGLLVLDLDNPDAVQMAEELGLPPTTRVKTAKGQHAYFRHPGFEVRNFVKKLAGVDARSDGGYVVGPPSTHPTGAVYEWITSPWEAAPADPPGWLLELIKPSRLKETAVKLERLASEARKTRALTDDQRARKYAISALVAEAREVAGSSEGTRNNRLNEAVFKVSQFIPIGLLSDGEVADELTKAARSAGLHDSEIESTIRSALVAGRQHPREIPEDKRREECDRVGCGYPERLNARECTVPKSHKGSVRNSALNEINGRVPKWIEEHCFKTAADTERLYHYDRGVYLNDGETVLAALIEAEFGDVTTNRLIQDVIGKVKRRTYVDRALFNNRSILNVKNGLLDLETLQLLPHTPDYLSTAQIDVPFVPGAKAPRIQKFLEEITQVEDIALVEEILGWLLWPSYDVHKAIMLLGPGRNGKGTLLRLITAFLGKKSISNVSLQDLVADRFAKADLYGKLANIGGDLPSKDLSDTAAFRNLTGGDDNRAQEKYRPAFSFRNKAKLIFSANVLPRSPDDTYAFYSRWVLIEFLNVFDLQKGTADPDLDAKLQTPEELSGLLNIALAGLARLRANGWKFSYDKSIEDVEVMYKRNANPVYAFLVDECESGRATDFIEKTTLYAAFQEYALKHGIRPLSSTKFSELLKDQAVIPVSTFRPYIEYADRPWCWQGVKFKDRANKCQSRLSRVAPTPSIPGKDIEGIRVGGGRGKGTPGQPGPSFAEGGNGERHCTTCNANLDGKGRNEVSVGTAATPIFWETFKAVFAFEKEGSPIVPFKLGQFLGLQTIGPLVKALKALGYRETKARSSDGMWIWSNVFPEEDGSVVSLGAIT
jgi:putative DNA primase/helicase